MSVHTWFLQENYISKGFRSNNNQECTFFFIFTCIRALLKNIHEPMTIVTLLPRGVHTWFLHEVNIWIGSLFQHKTKKYISFKRLL